MHLRCVRFGTRPTSTLGTRTFRFVLCCAFLLAKQLWKDPVTLAVHLELQYDVVVKQLLALHQFWTVVLFFLVKIAVSLGVQIVVSTVHIDTLAPVGQLHLCDIFVGLSFALLDHDHVPYGCLLQFPS